MATIGINGRTIEVGDGTTVLDAATAAGITIPTLCHHKDLSPVGSCRLCLVEIDGEPDQIAACTLPVRDGMAVQTETPALVESRRAILEMLLRNYHNAGYTHADRGETEFEGWLRHYDVRLPDGVEVKPRYDVDSDPNPFVWVDLNKCILCTRCVRACEEVQGRFVWSVGYRGHDAKIIAGTDTTMLDARCESCGACAAYCPTGALDDRASVRTEPPDRSVTTTCPYCGVGCQFDLNLKANRIVGVTSNPSAPVNGMSLCVKGRYGHEFVRHADRVTSPRVRRWLLDGTAKPASPEDRGDWIDVDWDTALNVVAQRFAAIRAESGPDAFGVLASAKCTNEENYLMQKFSRQVLGTHNVDHCARLCHSSTVAGLAMAFGSGAMSNSMDDIVEHAEAIFIIGSNTTEQHPVFGAMIRQAVLRRGVKLVVADPRAIDITEFATLHLRQRPGTDVALINGLMHLIVKHNWHDADFIAQRCEGFDELLPVLDKYTPDLVARVTGIGAKQLEQAAQLLAQNKPLAVIWAMGITQHTTGVINVLSLANLQMLLGNMGIPGGGVNPLRGQNNVQGACDMGALPNVYPGYQAVADEAAAQKFAQAWLVRSEPMHRVADDRTNAVTTSGKPGLTVTEMLDAGQRGDVRALYILGEDPAMTEPDSNHARQCLAATELIVLQEILHSETAAYADVLLPGASFAEKDGSFTNTERRVQLIRRAIDPPGIARPDWQITGDLASRLFSLEGRQPAGTHADWQFTDAAQIMDEIAAVTPSYAGVSHARLEQGERLQWPVPALDHAGTPILHVGRFTRGKGKFHAVEHLEAAELPDEEYPLILTTGRVIHHWHGGELTRRSAALLAAAPESLVEISPDDATRLRIADGGSITVRSRRGEMQACAVVTDRVAPGVIFGNFHFPGPANVNNLTIAALDPVAKIPEYKVCAVAIESASKR